MKKKIIEWNRSAALQYIIFYFWCLHILWGKKLFVYIDVIICFKVLYIQIKPKFFFVTEDCPSHVFFVLHIF